MRDLHTRVRDGFAPPARADLGWCCGVAAATLLACWSTGFATGLYLWRPDFGWDWMRGALIALVVPALAEEVTFRAAMIPTRHQRTSALPAMALSLLAYLLWHPVNAALFFPGAASYFSDWRFLLVTAMLGTGCALLWRRTGSIWPPALLHWLAVVVWKGALGAPGTL